MPDLFPDYMFWCYLYFGRYSPTADIATLRANVKARSAGCQFGRDKAQKLVYPVIFVPFVRYPAKDANLISPKSANPFAQ